MLLACRSLSKSFSAGPVLRDGYFHIEEKEKAAVVGINGAGKTTLLNILCGQMSADSGSVFFTKGKTLGYLTQHQDLDPAASIYDEVSRAKAPLLRMEEELRRTEQAMKGSSGRELEELMDRYSLLSHRFESEGGYACRSEIAGVLKGLGFTEADYGRPCGVLSGGEKTRLSLGRLLLTQPDLILLDEPTNHLDISSVEWLEGYLRDYPGAVIVVSHDRYFLDRVVTKVIEVENGLVSMFEGNYSVYAARKRQIRDEELKHYLNQQKEIRRQEESIARLRSFNREKSIKRAESKEKALARIERLEKPQEIRDAMHLTIEPHELSGKDVLSVRELSKSFGSRRLFSGLSFDISRGEKVALIGDNGSGKTTLLKILNGLVPPDEGSFTVGARVVIGYFDQEQQLLTGENTLFDEIRNAYPAMTDREIRQTLAAFLFTGDHVFQTVSSLSGGERCRLSLAKLMLSPCNFLILDEPTNHLDMTSREILEDALRSYTGTVFYVSHDRYFINRTVGRVLELDRQTLRSYEGNYDDYLEDKARRLDLAPPSGADAGRTAASESEQRRRAQKEEQARRARRENEIRKVEARIEELEEKSAALDAALSDPDIAGDYERLLPLSRDKEALQKEIETLFERWESLQRE